MASEVSSFSGGPFPNPDLSLIISQSLTLRDVGNCALVSRAWSKAMDVPGVWSTMFDNEEIPRIQNCTASKEDFRIMRHITFSKRAAEAAGFGQFIGKAPMISEKIFRRIKGKDVFEADEYNVGTHRVIVEPTHFSVPYSDALEEILLMKGDYDKKNTIDKKEMRIPYSAANILIIAAMLQKNEDYSDALCELMESTKQFEAVKEVSKVSTAVKVSIMRIKAPGITRDMKYSYSCQLLRNRNYEIAPFCTRFYFNLLEFCNKGTYPDKTIPVKTSDTVVEVNEDKSREIGKEVKDTYNVCIGDNDYGENGPPNVRFPDIMLVQQDEHFFSAAAVFATESDDSKTPSLGSYKRPYEMAFPEQN